MRQKRYGVEISRQTLANWMIRAFDQHLKPLYKLLHQELVSKEVLYDYQQGRSRDHAVNFIKGFKGFLHTDGYAGYHKLSKTKDGSPANVIQDLNTATNFLV